MIKEFCDDWPIDAIDFTLHLKPEYALNKKLTRSPNGRPLEALYMHEGTIMAKITWNFEVDDNNFLTKREEFLQYSKIEGGFSEPILIKTKEYDILTNPVDAELVIAERETARKSIVNSINIIVSGILVQALSQTIPQVTALTRNYMNSTKVEREAFIEVGDETWRNHLLGETLNINPAQNPDKWWLAIEFMEGVTIRDYIVSRLTY